MRAHQAVGVGCLLPSQPPSASSQPQPPCNLTIRLPCWGLRTHLDLAYILEADEKGPPVQGLPYEASALALALYALVLVVTGLTITWAGTACNNPIFAGIVQAQRTPVWFFASA